MFGLPVYNKRSQDYNCYMENIEKDEAAVKLGSKGGNTTKKRYGSDYYRELQKRSVKSKLKNKKKRG